MWWNVRPPRILCGEIKYIDRGQAHGITYHHIHKCYKVVDVKSTAAMAIHMVEKDVTSF